MAEQGKEGYVRALFDSVRANITAEGVDLFYKKAIYDRSGERRLVGNVLIQGFNPERWVALETQVGKGRWDNLIKVVSGQRGDWIIFASGMLSNEDVENYPEGSYRSVTYGLDGRRWVDRGILYEGKDGRARKINQGYPYLGELPERINMEATVAKFLEQVGKRDFSAPVWVEA